MKTQLDPMAYWRLKAKLATSSLKEQKAVALAADAQRESEAACAEAGVASGRPLLNDEDCSVETAE